MVNKPITKQRVLEIALRTLQAHIAVQVDARNSMLRFGNGLISSEWNVMIADLMDAQVQLQKMLKQEQERTKEDNDDSNKSYPKVIWLEYTTLPPCNYGCLWHDEQVNEEDVPYILMSEYNKMKEILQGAKR